MEPKRPKYPLRDLTEEEERYKNEGYVKFEDYPEGSPERSPPNVDFPVVGKFWTAAELDIAKAEPIAALFDAR